MTLFKLMLLADELYQCLQGTLSFDSNGWPIFQREYFLDEWPKDMVTFDNRTSSLIAPKEETLLCFYMGDVQNYRRFAKLQKDIPIYQQYKGVVVPDITITSDMDCELQEMLMLVNQLFAAYLAVNGIKIVFNTRNTSKTTVCHFKNIPCHIMCASGFLGCKKAEDIITAAPYINKILDLMPEKLIIYGKHDTAVDEQLNLLGINYRYYTDFHTRCKYDSIMKRGWLNGRL